MNHKLLTPAAIMRLVRQYGDAQCDYGQADHGSSVEQAYKALALNLEELIERRIRAALGESQ